VAERLEQRRAFLHRERHFLEERQSAAAVVLVERDVELGRALERAEMRRAGRGVVRAEQVADAVGHQAGAAVELGALARVGVAAGEQLEQQRELAMGEIEVEPGERLEGRRGVAEATTLPIHACSVRPGSSAAKSAKSVPSAARAAARWCLRPSPGRLQPVAPGELRTPADRLERDAVLEIERGRAGTGVLHAADRQERLPGAPARFGQLRQQRGLRPVQSR
jgi:hypothetical protein